MRETDTRARNMAEVLEGKTGMVGKVFENEIVCRKKALDKKKRGCNS